MARKSTIPYITKLTKTINGEKVKIARQRFPKQLGKSPKDHYLRSYGFESWAQAETFLAELSRQMQDLAYKLKDESQPELMARRAAMQAKRETISAQIPAYFEAIDVQRNQRALQNRRGNLKRFESWLLGEGRRFNSGAGFTREALQDFRRWLAKQPKLVNAEGGKRVETSETLAVSTANTIRRDVVAFLNWLSDREKIALHSAQITKGFASYKQDAKRPVYLNAEELKALVNAAVSLDLERHYAGRESKQAYSEAERGDAQGSAKYEPIAPMLLLAMLTGCRRGEVLHLQWQAVNWQRKTIRIQADRASGWNPKNRRERDIPFHDSPALERLLHILKAQAGSSRYIIKGKDASKPKNFRQPAWKRLVCAAEQEDRVFGDLRSTFASALAFWSQAGRKLTLADCAQRLGHSYRVAEKHYHGEGTSIEADSIESLLGVEQEVARAIDRLYPQKSAFGLVGAKPTA